MNTTMIRENTKSSIDTLMNEVDELKVKSDQISNNLKEEWNEELNQLESTKADLNNMYSKISEANEDAIKELTNAFNEQKASAEQRIDHLREIYSKMLN